MKHAIGSIIVILLFSLSASAQEVSPPPELRDRPDADPQTSDSDHESRLGGVFESQSAGVVFRAPANCREIRRNIAGDELVQYLHEQKKWQLKVSRAQFGEPLPLSNFRDANGKTQPGLLELTVKQLRMDRPGAEVLRDEIITVGDVSAASIAARYNLGTDTFLHQQALVRANDRNYFIFTLTSPAPRTGDVSQDRAVQEAVATFNAVIDSVRLLDQSSIKQDQDQRLYRTRALFLNVNENRLKDTLIDEQWLRIMRDGKDIGYMYVIEETASDLPRQTKGPGTRRPSAGDGVLIGMRSRTRPEEGVQVDAESWMWVSFDRRHERWSNVVVIDRNGKRDFASDLGASDRPTLSEARGEEKYTLTVQHTAKSSTAQPITRDLPVFYLPQALGHLLPRLVPRFEQKGYMFATYVADQREVMARYVDVGREEEITLRDEQVRAIPVRDRVGLEGSVTTHYMSPEGQYLGSINEDSKIVLLPTDAKTLEKLWRDPNLTRPGEVEENK